MKSLSSTVLALAPSMTVAIDTRAKALQASGLDVVGLGAGEPDFDTPDHIKEAAIASLREGRTKYTAPTGIPELKRAVSDKLLRENQVRIAPEQVVITSGVKHAVANVLQTLLNPGDEVVIPAPYWVTYPELVKLYGGTPVFIPTSVETQYKITPAQLEAAITPHTKALILCNPSNPTGMVYGKADLEAFAEILVRHDVYVVTDEIYEHILYDERTPLSIASLGPEILSRSLIVNGLSKAYAMTGWRVGYFAGPAPIAKAIGALQSQATHHPANPSQYAAVAALDGGLDFVHEMVREFSLRRDFVVGSLQSIPGVIAPNPEGAFYALPEVSHFYGRKTPAGKTISGSLDLCEFLLADHLLAVVPGIAFGDDRCIRLSYATSMQNLERAMVRLKSGLSSLV
ncbi:MAG: pyridoxal phosphate-dependent aminotransferase [Fibrobacterota bacterium]|nr:pyridoxal phosphate-dependent aminotransferase [Fibrobacterota bacterium]QQS07458.1 MAG: pyridoxal phosphate-dependent aminotransferase [Fibrobacterota bacterium]